MWNDEYETVKGLSVTQCEYCQAGYDLQDFVCERDIVVEIIPSLLPWQSPMLRE